MTNGIRSVRPGRTAPSVYGGGRKLIARFGTERADTISGIPGRAIQTDAVELHHDGIARFGAFDIERSSQRIAVSLRVTNALIVESGGIDRLRDDDIARARIRASTGMRARKRVVVDLVHDRVDAPNHRGCQRNRDRQRRDACIETPSSVTPCRPTSLAVFAKIQIAGHRVAGDSAGESVRQTLTADGQRCAKLNLVAIDRTAQVAFERPSDMRA